MSNKLINIGGDPNDIYYRYKMSPLQTKIEGRGNGTKTILLNICTVANNLRTQPSYLVKFFGIEVAAQSKYDDKRNVGRVNGQHQKKELQLLLNKFINNFILCPICKQPSLRRADQTKRYLLQICRSCGWRGKNSSNHKVKAYIIKHPTKKSKSKQKKGGRKKERRKKKRRKNDNNISDSEWLDDETWSGWSVDISDKAVLERKQQEMIHSNILKNNEEKKEININDKSAKQILTNYMNSSPKSDLQILNEIKRISLARKMDQTKRLQISIDVLCNLDTLDPFIESLRNYKVIWKTYTSNAKDTKVFFGVLEQFICGRTPDEFLGNVSKILGCLYSEGIVNRDNILLWFDLPAYGAIIVNNDEAVSIRNHAAQFIKLLRENK